MDKGLRYNVGKPRAELVPSKPLNYVIDVYTKGAHKYSVYEDIEGKQYKGTEISLEEAAKMKKVYDGADNWRNGLSWRECMAAVRRHINKWDEGEDFDKELGTYHLANSAWGLLTLLEFYTTHPERDDRKLPFLQDIRFGIDIDDVLADFLGAYCARYNIEKPSAWMFDRTWDEHYEEIIKDPDFYLDLETIIKPNELPFEPTVYITSRDERLKQKTLQWLFDHNKYPVAPVVFAKDKLTACKEHKVERFIDDKYSTFVNLNKNGVFCYLFDASHNQRYNVGYRRINKDSIKNIL